VGNFLSSSGRFSFSGRTLLHGVSKYLVARCFPNERQCHFLFVISLTQNGKQILQYVRDYVCLRSEGRLKIDGDIKC
jgi:hypothetical protein